MTSGQCSDCGAAAGPGRVVRVVVVDSDGTEDDVCTPCWVARAQKTPVSPLRSKGRKR